MNIIDINSYYTLFIANQIKYFLPSFDKVGSTII